MKSNILERRIKIKRISVLGVALVFLVAIATNYLFAPMAVRAVDEDESSEEQGEEPGEEEGEGGEEEGEEEGEEGEGGEEEEEGEEGEGGEEEGEEEGEEGEGGEEEGEEEKICIVNYDLNGGMTAEGEATVSMETGPFGLILSGESLLEQWGVIAPEGKVLNYVEVNGAAHNIGDGYFIEDDTTIVYYWRDDTDVFHQITFDPNGGEVIDFPIPEALPHGQTFALNGMDSDQVRPPEGKVFDAFEINDERYEIGTAYTVEEDGELKLLWRDARHTVHFETGSILPDDRKFVDQVVNDGAAPDYPVDSLGKSLLDYLDENGDFIYEGYMIEGFYTDPDLTREYLGGPITEDTTLYAKWVLINGAAAPAVPNTGLATTDNSMATPVIISGVCMMLLLAIAVAPKKSKKYYRA